MNILPPALNDLIDAFNALPGVGPRTAERYAYWFIRHDTDHGNKLASALQALPGGISYCKKTFALVANGVELSELYTNPKRDKTLIAVVAEPFDIIAMEKTGQFFGTYHVFSLVLCMSFIYTV